jgi:ABC transport system ATP-binding/permease protein
MRNSWIIGVAESCDIRIQSAYVSGNHCRLERVDGQWFLEDLNSTNGTYVNGIRLNGRSAVSAADRITLGHSVQMPWPSTDTPGVSSRSPTVVPLLDSGKPIVIGRAASCNVVLNFPMISSRHATIERTNGGWAVRDLGSTNGTFVEGRRVHDVAVLRPGEVISLGSYQLLLSADGRTLSSEEPHGHSALEAKHVSIAVAGRELVRDVSMVVRAGELVGVMGNSGVGKSTLLSAFVGYHRPSSGQVAVSGLELYARIEELRGQIGYVPQDDIMHAELTVRQALWYSARLRLPRDYSNEEIGDRITAVLHQLGLEGVGNTRIGSPERRGISGGERKRVNVAMELVTDPQLLVLDEPTSGLSSVDALSLIRVLRALAADGRSVVLTIHQPSIDMLKLMDGLAVLAKDNTSNSAGELVWYGRAYPDAGQFFEPGVERPDAEAVLRGLDSRQVSEWQRAYRATEAYRRWGLARCSPEVAVPVATSARRSTVADGMTQLLVLTRRMLSIRLSDPWGTLVLLAQAPVIALLVVAVFGAKVSKPLDEATWRDVSSAIASTTFLMGLAAIWFGCANASREIVGERAIFRRERMVGMSLYSYLAAKVLVLGSLCAVQCVLLMFVVERGAGLHASYVSVVPILFLAANVAVAIGLCISSIVRSGEAAAAILPLVVLPMVILGGILLPLKELPAAAAVLADAMPSRWAFEKLVTSEADARPVLEVRHTEPAGQLEVQDIAERWFPLKGWRSSPGTPALILAGMWAIVLWTVRSLLIRGDGQR